MKILIIIIWLLLAVMIYQWVRNCELKEEIEYLEKVIEEERFIRETYRRQVHEMKHEMKMAKLDNIYNKRYR